MDDETFRPGEDEARSGGELLGHELAHVVQQAEPGEVAPNPEGQTRGEEVTHVVESAAELGLGAVIAPFTGGETVPIIASVASMLEAGFDRLTHLGEHESPPELEATDAGGAYGADE